MTDSETPPEASIEERFRIVHDHLDLVDRTLDELAGELETELKAVLEDTSVDVEYDIDTGSFQAALSIEHVVSRLNERLEPPLFARVDDEAETIRIGDIRRLYDIDPETLAAEEGHATSMAKTGQRLPLKDIIRQLQQADEQRGGVLESAVIELCRMLAAHERTSQTNCNASAIRERSIHRSRGIFDSSERSG